MSCLWEQNPQQNTERYRLNQLPTVLPEMQTKHLDKNKRVSDYGSFTEDMKL